MIEVVGADGNQGRLETMTETEDLNGVKDKRTTVTEILEETKMYHQSSGRPVFNFVRN